MNILAVDCVSTSFSAAVKSSDKLYSSYRIKERDHNKHLVSDISALLKKAAISFEELDLIIIGKGPGSFTAVRIEFATLKTAAYAAGIDIIAVNSLRALSRGLAAYDAKIKVAAVDAKKKSFYANVYLDDKLLYDNADIPIEALIELMKKEESALLIGDAYSFHAKHLHKQLPGLIKVEDEKANVIHAEELINIYEEDGDDAQKRSFFSLLPDYVRMSEAEYKKLKRSYDESL